MADHPVPASDLGVVVPTLEPDPAFLDRLSSLAAASGASAQLATRPTPSGWWVGLAAASVAAVLLVIAWLGGQGAQSTPDPAPAPASKPAGTDASRTARAAHEPRSQRTSESRRERSATVGQGVAARGSSGLPGDRSAPPSLREPEPAVTSDRQAPQGRGPVARSDDLGDRPSAGESHDQQRGPDNEGDDRGTGPDEHAGDHPDDNAFRKSNGANPSRQEPNRSPGGGHPR